MKKIIEKEKLNKIVGGRLPYQAVPNIPLIAYENIRVVVT